MWSTTVRTSTGQSFSEIRPALGEGGVEPLAARGIGGEDADRVCRQAVFGGDFREEIALGLVDRGIQESRPEVDADESALLGQGLEHVVAHVAMMGRQGPAAGVGGHDRRLGQFQHVPERRIGGVRHVDDHPQPIHLGHDLPPEFREPAMDGLGIARGVGPIRRRPVCQGHEPNAGPEEFAQEDEVVLDGVAALDPDEDAGLLVPRGGGVPRRQDQSQVIGILVDQGVDRLDLGEDAFGRAGLVQVGRRRGGEAGEDLKIDAAALELGDVDVPLGQIPGQVLAGQCISTTMASR